MTGLLTFLRGRFKRRVRLFRKVFLDIFEHGKMGYFRLSYGKVRLEYVL